MNIKRLVRLPWKLKDVLRSMRQDLADSRRTMAELLQLISALELRHGDLKLRHGDLELRHGELTEELRRERQEERTLDLGRERRREEEMSWLRETLLGEIREQGLLMETAARFLPRAAAEMKLRNQLTPPHHREAGLSVLITCWNHAGFLGRSVATAVATLESLLVPGEVLILDDASRDGSREVAQELARADERIRLIPSDENLGLPRARNVLLSQAQFEHAMILDSDNQLVPSGIATLYAAARQTGAVLAYGNILQVDESGSVMGVISNERVTANLVKENWIDAMILVRTDRLLELGGYDWQWLYGLEDWELNLRLFSLREPMVFVPVLVGKYTTLPLSMLREAPSSTRYRRALRIFACVDATDSARYRACIHHPALGTIWASAGWSSPAPEPPIRAVPQRTPSRLKVLVVTSGGVRNYGDDAILLSTLQRLRRIRPNCLASVVSDGPSCPPLGRLGVWAGTCEEFGSGLNPDDVRRGCRDDGALAEELSRWLKFGSHTRTDLKSFDLVLVAGGGNLNIHWPDLIARRAAFAAAANAAGVPYILTGQGVGPVSADIVPMLSFLVGGASAVATRDPLSLRLLRRIVPHGPPIAMVGDDALGLRIDGPLVARGQLAEIGVPLDRPLLGFQARETSYVGFSRDELKDTARQVDDFAAENGYVVVAVPINMQSHSPEVELLADLAFGSRRRASWHVVNHAGDVAATAGVIKVCSAVLTHSYHAAIFALENRIPTLLFARTEYYHLKGEALRTAFGIPVSLIALPHMADGAIALQLEKISQSSWSRGMTSADVDAWLDGALPRDGGGVGTMSIARFDRAALGIAG
jgi:polysaccharide pyruvyl transferase WcaK-like protein